MTESQWLTCVEPQKMLEWLRHEGRLTERKARLFAVACCRRIWHLLTDERWRNAVETGERYADGLATVEEMRRAAWRVSSSDHSPQTTAVCCTIVQDNEAFDFSDVPGYLAGMVLTTVVDVVTCICDDFQKAFAVRTAERAALAGLFRDLLGPLPFGPVTIDPSWLTPQVVALAQSIYDDRAFGRMPELRAALAAAGCDNGPILGHCRQVVGHVKGCWVVDSLLSKV